jgi:hypothetical protein
MDLDRTAQNSVETQLEVENKYVPEGATVRRNHILKRRREETRNTRPTLPAKRTKTANQRFKETTIPVSASQTRKTSARSSAKKAAVSISVHRTNQDRASKSDTTTSKKSGVRRPVTPRTVAKQRAASEESDQVFYFNDSFLLALDEEGESSKQIEEEGNDDEEEDGDDEEGDGDDEEEDGGDEEEDGDDEEEHGDDEEEHGDDQDDENIDRIPLLAAKSKSSSSYIDVELGNVYRLQDGKHAIAIYVSFTTDDAGVRCKSLRVECWFSRPQDPDNPPVVTHYKPRQVYGKDGEIDYEKEGNVGLKDPHSGGGISGKLSRKKTRKFRWSISGRRFGAYGKPTTNVKWVMKENKADQAGIPVNFRGLVIIDPMGHSMGLVDMHLKVWANIPGTILELLTPRRKGVKQKFTLDLPNLGIENPKNRTPSSFTSWTGQVPGGECSWVNHPF